MKLFRLVLRDLARRRWKPIAVFALFLLAYWGLLLSQPYFSVTLPSHRWAALLLLTFIVWLAIAISRTLTDIFSLHRQESAVTWCQLSILMVLVVWLIGFIVIFDAMSHPLLATTMGIVGTVLGWIFQDTLKGIVAFIHLRLNHLLSIDDWIQIPKYNVDGTVSRVTLTTVTISNWDTTTSSVPTSALHSDHFINLQKMADGKTYGRKMSKTFTLDTGWIGPLSADDARQLQQTEAIVRYVPAADIKAGMLNARLFRLYLFHWLMGHPHVSQLPRLVVRWLDPVDSGLPLQVYAFLTDSSLVAFEWQQSLIVEHVVESLSWFGLRLYQSPSGYDASNSNIQLTSHLTEERKEKQP